MNFLSSLGSGLFTPSRTGALLPAIAQQFPNSQKAPSSQAVPARDTASLSKTGIDLSKQQDALAQRVDTLGGATVDMAQNFLTNFAQSLFGDAAKGMTIEFDSASVSASSSFSAAVQHSEGPQGSSDAAGFRLEDSASFTGKGVITTADGHRFNFEVEVQYQAVAEAAASRTAGVSNQQADRAGQRQHEQEAAPQHNLSVDFPGTVADLFHMMEQNKLQMSFLFPANEQSDETAKQGSLMLRLLGLIDSPNTLNTKLAKAYGVSSAPEAAA